MNKFHLKSFTAGIILCAMAFTFFNVYAESAAKTIEVMYSDIKVMVGGREVNPVNSEGKAVRPFTYDGEVYLPVSALKALSEYVVKTDEGKSTISFYKKTPDVKLTDEVDIEDYLIDNYSLIKTSQGNCRLEFTIFQRLVKSNSYDYHIKIVMQSSFYYDNISTITSMLPSDEFETVNAEVKAHMAAIAYDLIQKLPGKKLQGCYDQSYDKDITKKKKEHFAIEFCNWANYQYSRDSDYDKAKATEDIFWLAPFNINYIYTVK